MGEISHFKPKFTKFTTLKQLINPMNIQTIGNFFPKWQATAAFLLLILFFSFPLFGQSDLNWSQHYGGTQSDIAENIKTTADNHFILAGHSNSNNQDITANQGLSDFLLLKTTQDGNIVWQRSYGGSQNDFAHDVAVTDDGYALAGVSYSSNGQVSNQFGNGDIWIVKTDLNGNINWQRSYGSNQLDIAKKIIPTIDGGYLLAGMTHSNDIASTNGTYAYGDIWLIKINATGDIEWQQTLNGSRSEIPTALLQTATGDFMLAGISFSKDGDFNNFGNSDAFIAKINKTGSLQWVKNYGGTANDAIHDLKASKDGNYIATGYRGLIDITATGVKPDYDEQAWVLKIDTNGNEQWNRTFGGSKYEQAQSIATTLDGGYILTANTESFDNGINTKGKKDTWVIKLASNGDMQWQRTYGGFDTELTQAIIELPNGSYTILSYSMSDTGDVYGNKGNQDIWLFTLEGSFQLTVDLGADQNICIGESITLNATACNTCSYLWNDGSTDAVRTISPVFSNYYSVSVNDNNGHTASDDIFIRVNAGPQIEFIATTNESCSGNDGSIEVQATGGTGSYTYLWNDGATTSFRENLSAGMYSFTLTDGNNCSLTEQIEIAKGNTIELSSIITPVSCVGNDGAIELVYQEDEDLAYTFLWNTGDTTANIYNLNPGTYSVTVNNSSNCQAVGEYIVAQGGMLDFDAAIGQTVCGANTGFIELIVTNNSDNYTYTWNTGATTQNIYDLSEGTYSVTVENGTACQAIREFIIERAYDLTLNATTTPASCENGMDGAIDLLVEGATFSVTYLWNTGATSEDLDNLSANIYSVTVTDQNGCTASKEILIEQEGSLALEIISTDPTCVDENSGILEVVFPNNGSNYNYAWNNGETTAKISNLAPGTYTVSVNDGNNCQGIASASINNPDTINIQLEVSNADCFGEADGRITAIINGGSSPYIYEWNNGAITQNIEQLNAGTYSITVTDINGCTASASADLQQSLAADIDIVVNHPSCDGYSNGYVQTTVAGGTGNYTYLWNTGQTNASLYGLTGGDYTLTISDGTGCEYVEEVAVIAPMPIEINSISTPITCAGLMDGAIELMVTGGTGDYNFAWSNGEATQNIYDLPKGDYLVTVSDVNNCARVAYAGVIEPMVLFVQPAKVQPISCHEANDGLIEIDVLGGTPPYTYQWDNGATTQNIDSLAAGDYTINVNDANDCETSATFTIVDPKPMQTNINIKHASCLGVDDGEIEVIASGGTGDLAIEWNHGPDNFRLGALAVGNYNAIVKDENTCVRRLNFQIEEMDSISAEINVINPSGIDNNGSIFVYAKGGLPPYTYKWDNSMTGNSLFQLESGNYQLTISDSNGCKYTNTIALGDDMTTATAQISTSWSIDLYPNPTTNQLNILFKNKSTNTNYSATIYDALGTAIDNFVFQDQNVNTIKLKPTLSSGVYFIKIRNEKAFSIHRFIIQ